MRLGVVLTQARVLLRLRGREERDYHEEHAIQHGCLAVARVRGVRDNSARRESTERHRLSCMPEHAATLQRTVVNGNSP